MAFGAVGEGFRRATGSQAIAGGSLMLSATNMERLVAKLSKMRGAALKLGQMMSFQGKEWLLFAGQATDSIRLEDAPCTRQWGLATGSG